MIYLFKIYNEYIRRNAVCLANITRVCVYCYISIQSHVHFPLIRLNLGLIYPCSINIRLLQRDTNVHARERFQEDNFIFLGWGVRGLSLVNLLCEFKNLREPRMEIIMWNVLTINTYEHFLYTLLFKTDHMQFIRNFLSKHLIKIETIGICSTYLSITHNLICKLFCVGY